MPMRRAQIGLLASTEDANRPCAILGCMKRPFILLVAIGIVALGSALAVSAAAGDHLGQKSNAAQQTTTTTEQQPPNDEPRDIKGIPGDNAIHRAENGDGV